MVAQPSIFKEVKYWEVGYRDLQELIKKHYGVKEINLVAMRGWRNDTKVTVYSGDFGNLEPEELAIRIQKPWHWKDNSYGLQDILYDLVQKSLIPNGELLINVSW